jgi:integrase
MWGQKRSLGAHNALWAEWFPTSAEIFRITCDGHEGSCFLPIGWGTGSLTRSRLPQANAYAIIQRPARAGGIRTRIGNHTFRATGITAYLKNGGTLEKAAMIANHTLTRTTQLYDRRNDEVSLDEVERILI